MKKSKYLFVLLGVVIVAFWQIFFLQNGMKWDFVDAFLPSRYFFSESILNNQFPLWNPYLIYGVPVYADLVSVFNPEFWIVGNMFGYSNITLQYVYLGYIFLSGVSFSYFLKQFKTAKKLSLALSVAYMLSGFSVGNAQHLAFISGYAIMPFVLAAYFRFVKHLNKGNFINLSIALFLMVYCSYPALTIILGYLLLVIFVYHLIVNRSNREFIRKSVAYHLALAIIVILSSTVLIVAYTQGLTFLSRYSGLAQNLSLKHPFTIKSLLSWLVPMATGSDVEYFATDASMSNGYWGLISFVLFLFTLTKKVQNRAAYIFLFFGIFSLLASFGKQFLVREFLYNYVPLMNMFQYPSIFRAFTIFCFLAFTGLNLNTESFFHSGKKRLVLIAGVLMFVLLGLVVNAGIKLESFVFFDSAKSFSQEIFRASRFDAVFLQGIFQIFFLLIFILITLKIRSSRKYFTALLLLFIADGIAATQLNIHYTVISKTDPIEFYKYLKSSPKGFPTPQLTPVKENSDKNASNEFVWMNNNVFPKKITFDGSLSFKSDGYMKLEDNYPALLDSVKNEAVLYLSGDIREDSGIENFNSNTVFLPAADYEKLKDKVSRDNIQDDIEIIDFSPKKIEVKVDISNPQILTYQQNFFKGWKVYVDREEQNLLKSNFTHMSVFVPAGEHTVLFKYSNWLVIFAFCFSTMVFLSLVFLAIRYYLKRNPEKKKQVFTILGAGIFLFVLMSGINRFFYNRNKLGLTKEIIEKNKSWKEKYGADIRSFVSSGQKQLKEKVDADTVVFINENTNIAALSYFLMNSDTKYFAFAWQGSIIKNDLFDLMYSFYPNVIEHKRDNNSGYILVGKSEEKQNYSFEQDFESAHSNGWTVDDSRVWKNPENGNHSYMYTPKTEWGTTLVIPIDKEMLRLQKISIFADVLIENIKKEILLLITTEREGKIQVYEVFKIDRYISEPGYWQRVVLGVDLKSKIQEGDVIKAYFWNINKASFKIDNLKVKFDTQNNS